MQGFRLRTNVNQHVYLDMLQTLMWPKRKEQVHKAPVILPARWATSHTTVLVDKQVWNSVISRFTERPWPWSRPFPFGFLVLLCARQSSEGIPQDPCSSCRRKWKVSERRMVLRQPEIFCQGLNPARTVWWGHLNIN